jgi:hypothetical protein
VLEGLTLLVNPLQRSFHRQGTGIGRGGEEKREQEEEEKRR